MNTKKTLSKIGCCIGNAFFIVLGLILTPLALYYGGLSIYDELALNSRGVVIHAVVVDTQTWQDSGTERYQVQYQFTVGESDTVYSCSDRSGRHDLWCTVTEEQWDDLQSTRQVAVRYLPSNPWANRAVHREPASSLPDLLAAVLVGFAPWAILLLAKASSKKSADSEAAQLEQSTIPLNRKAITVENARRVEQLGLMTPGKSIFCVAFSPDGKLLIFNVENDVWLVTIEEGLKSSRVLTGHTDYVCSLAININGALIATAGHDEDSTARLWNVETGREIASLFQRGMADKVAFSADGLTLATISAAGTLRLWDISHVSTQQQPRLTQELYDRYQGATETVTAIAYSPDGNLMALTSSLEGYCVAHLEEVRTGKRRASLSHPGLHTEKANQVYRLAFSPDSRVLATGDYQGAITLWNTRNARERVKWQGHDASVNGLVFSPDGQVLASCSWDNSVRLWNAQTGEALNTFRQHSGHVNGIAFSPDGSLIASGGWDNTVRLWGVTR